MLHAMTISIVSLHGVTAKKKHETHSHLRSIICAISTVESMKVGTYRFTWGPVPKPKYDMDAHGKIRITYLIQIAGTCATAKAEKMIWRSRDIAIKPWMPFPSIVHCSRMLLSNMLYRSISWKSTVCKAEGSKAFDFITSARSKGSGTCVIILCTRIYLQKKIVYFSSQEFYSMKWQKGGPEIISV